MSRPLFVTDCDEVILHMIGHFAEWLDEEHKLHFAFDAPGFCNAVRGRDGAPVSEDRIWPLLDGFFKTEMHRQNIVPGAAEALAEISAHADIVILTNIGDEFHAGRIAQLEAFDIRHRVVCNRGGKGGPVKTLIGEMSPSAAMFVDDLSIHHESVARHAPDVWRLHMIADPRLAAAMPPSEHAHARIDDWGEALPWIFERLGKA